MHDGRRSSPARLARSSRVVRGGTNAERASDRARADALVAGESCDEELDGCGGVLGGVQVKP